MKADKLRRQSGLVFQGGGALGAYQAGTYQEIYKHAKSNHPENRLFDIVAGTSIGAINASVLVGHYLKKGNSWEGSDKALLEFWEGLSSTSIADAIVGANPAIGLWWDYMHLLNPKVANAESARRFWSIFEFSFTTLGVPKMFRPTPQRMYKFLNPFTDFLPWWRYDFEPLSNYLRSYVDFPIKTDFADGQPRLLLTSVDVQDYTTAVVFDSYKKQHHATEEVDATIVDNPDLSGEWFSRYGSTDRPHIVFYNGIGVEQVLASALGKYSLNHPAIEDSVTRTRREFWDGGYLSNTPLRELLSSHRRYWRESYRNNLKAGQRHNFVEIPELEIYIVNLHPKVADSIPTEKDLIDNRENDIIFHDRTTFDEMVAYLRTDYVDMALKLIALANSNGLSSEVEHILSLEAKSIARMRGEFRSATYRDIVDGRAKVSKIWNIDRRDSANATFGKTTDFTPLSIRELINEGRVDARISLNRMKILFAIEDLIAAGLVAAADGDDVMSKIHKILQPEVILSKSHAEVVGMYDSYVKLLERLVQHPERRTMLLEPAEDILELIGAGHQPSFRKDGFYKGQALS
jgi:predicted acylesterase/phospholipase RssA